jgi:hypothetical protein
VVAVELEGQCVDDVITRSMASRALTIPSLKSEQTKRRMVSSSFITVRITEWMRLTYPLSHGLPEVYPKECILPTLSGLT